MASQKVEFGLVNISCVSSVFSGPKFTNFYRRTWARLQLISRFPLVDIFIRSGDIRDRSLKLRPPSAVGCALASLGHSVARVKI